MHPRATLICLSISPSSLSVGAGGPATGLMTSTESRYPSGASTTLLHIASLIFCSKASICCWTDARLSREADERFLVIACFDLASSISRFVRFFRILFSRLLSFFRLAIVDFVDWDGACSDLPESWLLPSKSSTAPILSFSNSFLSPIQHWGRKRLGGTGRLLDAGCTTCLETGVEESLRLLAARLDQVLVVQVVDHGVEVARPNLFAGVQRVQGRLPLP
mmetsp:Transcript_3684/g.10592  ORF Transcript_3684/g.10592 Transcript_3684/m.10592 type:complete len:220 (-) Transcript_3684:1000-1659(-)